MNYIKQQTRGDGRHNERGVVSIFVVIFAAIFMTIITASFITIMITDQHQATTMDLSQSAYDAAMSGVEDAKRAIVFCQTAPATNTGCQEIKSTPSVAGNDCTLLGKVGVSGFVSGTDGNQEVPIQSTEGANTLDQAYTCVGITTQSPDVQTSINAGQVSLIPLQSDKPFDSIAVSWNTAASSTQSVLPAPVITKQFSVFSDWAGAAKDYPPVMQTSLMTVGAPINQTEFDQAPGAGKTGAATLMLRPSTLGVPAGFSADPRAGGGTMPVNITCKTGANFSPAGPYTCTATISLGFTLNPGQQAYLALQPIYQAADINVELKQGLGGVDFTNVQAVVDSTGRANDIFRRVSARVNLVPITGNYPNAALNLSGSLCKDFTLPSTATNLYTSSGAACK